jgi:hypothetical protein
MLAREAVATLDPHTIGLRGGESQDVYINLGADRRPDVDLKARLVSTERWPDPERVRVHIVRNVSQERGRETILRHTPGGRILWLEVLVEPCATPGVYPFAVEVSSQEPPLTNGTRSIRIPLRLKIEGSSACWLGSGGYFLLVLPIGLLAFYGWTSIAHSRFLSARQLAEVLRPYRWNEGGGTEPIEKATAAVRGRMESQMRFIDRAKAWLLANPLMFGLPFRLYEETVEILPGRKVENLHLILQRRSRRYFERNPQAAKGRLFITASAVGPVAFGLPERGRLGGLIPDRNLDPDHVKALGSLELRNDTEGRSGQQSGWRILQARQRRAGRAAWEVARP